MKKKAIYPGSFDPMTLGHVDIVKRMLKVFDEIIVLVANSPKKNYLFTAAERVSLVERCFEGVANVRAEAFDGLTIDFARQAGAQVIIRGLRAVADFEYEMAMASLNKRFEAGIETLIAFASPEFNCVSSRMIKEVSYYGGSLHGLVPDFVETELKKKMATKKIETKGN